MLTFLSVNKVIDEAACSKSAQKKTENAISSNITKVWLLSFSVQFLKIYINNKGENRYSN